MKFCFVYTFPLVKIAPDFILLNLDVNSTLYKLVSTVKYNRESKSKGLLVYHTSKLMLAALKISEYKQYEPVLICA
jgi:hypothetical protein